MPTQFPFRFISGLPPKAQEEIWRDFQAIAAAVDVPNRVYDAYVNPEATVDNIDTRTFTTPFAAIKYVADTLGQWSANIGILRPIVTSNNVSMLETANYSGTNICAVSIDVIGAGEMFGTKGDGISQGITWDMQTFTDSAKFAEVHLRNIQHNSDIGAGSSPFQRASLHLYAANCRFQANNHYRMIADALVNCNINGPSWGGTLGDRTYLDGCVITGGGTETITRSLITRNCHFDTFGPTITGYVFIAIGASFQQYSSGAGGFSGCSMLFNNNQTSRIIIDSVGEDTPLEQGLALTISANVETVWIHGIIRSLVLAAPAAVNGAVHYVSARFQIGFDITGPANIDVAVANTTTTKCFLRGPSISGSAELAAYKFSGITLSLVGVTDSVLQVVFNPFGAAGTGQAYSIDVASLRNTIIFAGDSLLPTSSTNSSTTTRIITHIGSSGIDSTAIHIADILLTLGANTNGVQVIPPPAPGSAPTGPAGGSLNNSYPDPTFAGRDSSVDKINQDMLPAFLADPNGVQVIPAPVSSGTGVDLRDFQHEFMAELTTGVKTYPAPWLSTPPDTPGAIQMTTPGTAVGTVGASSSGYRKAFLKFIDKSAFAFDDAVIDVDIVYQGALVVTDGVISGTTNLQSTIGGFTAAMTGMFATCPGTIPAGTTVTFVNANNVTLSAASTNASGLLVDIAPLIKTTGITAKAFTPRDNGGDTSAIFGLQTGGGVAVTGYKTSGRRPAGYQDYSLSTQGAAEFGTDGGSHALIAISGVTIFGVAGLRSSAVYARIDNSVSDGILVAPNDAVYDKRLGIVFGNRNINAAPTLQKFYVMLDGTIETKGLVSAGGVSLTPALEATGVQVFPAVTYNSPNLDGGAAESVYGGTVAIDGGGP